MESSLREAQRRSNPENVGALRSPGLLRFARNEDRGSTKCGTATRKWRRILLELHETRPKPAGVRPVGGPSPNEAIRLRVVKQRDRLGVGDRAAPDHRQRLAERDLEDLDMLV